MTNRILWIICGVLVIGSIIFFTVKYFKSDKKVSGIKISNINGLSSPGFSQVPVKNKSANDPDIFAKSVFLIDHDSSHHMYEKSIDEKVAIASTTKIATALVVLENYQDKLNDEVTITYKMIAVEGSDIQLRPGEKITVSDLVDGLLIMSGNDAAYALAEHFGGKEKFVAEMNDKVRSIGAFSTEYKDPAGLNDEGYSTAHDLAMIASYALNNKRFAETVSTAEKTIVSKDGLVTHELKNSNRMLREEEEFYYPYARGIKTGFTNAAGHVLVSCAEKNNHKLVAIVLNTQENSLTASAQESKKLLEWGFNNFQW